MKITPVRTALVAAGLLGDPAEPGATHPEPWWRRGTRQARWTPTAAMAATMSSPVTASGPGAGRIGLPPTCRRRAVLARADPRGTLPGVVVTHWRPASTAPTRRCCPTTRRCGLRARLSRTSGAPRPCPLDREDLRHDRRRAAGARDAVRAEPGGDEEPGHLARRHERRRGWRHRDRRDAGRDVAGTHGRLQRPPSATARCTCSRCGTASW